MREIPHFPALMQEKNAPHDTFLHRTDRLAVRMGINLQDLPRHLGISRRTLFAGRSDEKSVTAKTLLRLEKAESAAREPVENAGFKKVQKDADPNQPETHEARIARLERSQAEAFAAIRDLTRLLEKQIKEGKP